MGHSYPAGSTSFAYHGHNFFNYQLKIELRGDIMQDWNRYLGYNIDHMNDLVAAFESRNRESLSSGKITIEQDMESLRLLIGWVSANRRLPYKRGFESVEKFMHNVLYKAKYRSFIPVKSYRFGLMYILNMVKCNAPISLVRQTLDEEIVVDKNELKTQIQGTNRNGAHLPSSFAAKRAMLRLRSVASLDDEESSTDIDDDPYSQFEKYVADISVRGGRYRIHYPRNTGLKKSLLDDIICKRFATMNATPPTIIPSERYVDIIW